MAICVGFRSPNKWDFELILHFMPWTLKHTREVLLTEFNIE